MLWFLILHIIALLFWCATLLYLPVLITVNGHGHIPLSAPKHRGSMARFIFTNISSPAALVAIMAGTAVFLLNYTIDIWLVVKLTLVTGLVIVHTLVGLFLLYIDNHPEKPVTLWCWLLEIIFITLIGMILWIVLAKPDFGGL